ncbi:MAG: FecR domain-containing protein [Myxococcaceae bacterium]
MSEPKKRSNLPFIAGVLAILALLPLAYWLLLGRDEGLPPPPPPKPVAQQVIDAGPKKAELKLSEVTGKVTVKRGDGAWVEAKAGDALSESDGVRTEDGSYAVLAGGEYWEVKMEPGTEVQVGELSDSISKILLGSGMARAKVKAGKHTFEVRSTRSDAVASTSNGSFTVSNDGNGTVAVGTQEGEVQFAGKGKVVIVRAGEQSIAKANEEPSAPKAIPNSLLLKVALPSRQLTNKPKMQVTGVTEPGTWVEIAGHTTIADRTGKFRIPLLLTEGNNAIEIKARGVGGKEADSKHAIEVDSTVKKTSVKIDWGTQK